MVAGCWECPATPWWLAHNCVVVQEGEFIEVFLLPMRGLYDALLVSMTLNLQCRT